MTHLFTRTAVELGHAEAKLNAGETIIVVGNGYQQMRRVKLGNTPVDVIENLDPATLEPLKYPKPHRGVQ